MRETRTRAVAGKDDRPRVYIRGDLARSAWRIGVGGTERVALTPGSALNEALDEIGFESAVIFWEGRSTS